LSAAVTDLDELNLPEGLRQKIEDRKIIDRELEIGYPVEGAVSAPALPEKRRRTTERSGVVMMRETKSPQSEIVAQAAVPEKIIPLRGYRIPLRNNGEWYATLPPNLSEGERRAAFVISQQLAANGLLRTLAQVIETLGPEALTNGILSLTRIGFR
jgi:hypothetical protein